MRSSWMLLSARCARVSGWTLTVEVACNVPAAASTRVDRHGLVCCLQGFCNQVMSLYDAVAHAYLLNASLILPSFYTGFDYFSAFVALSEKDLSYDPQTHFAVPMEVSAPACTSLFLSPYSLGGHAAGWASRWVHTQFATLRVIWITVSSGCTAARAASRSCARGCPNLLQFALPSFFPVLLRHAALRAPP